MWQEQMRARFQQLRQRQLENTLTEAEEAELTILLEELEAAEAADLAPAVEQLRQEREAIEAQNRSLENLVHRKEALASRLRTVLVEAQAERRAIESELATVLAGSQGSTTDD
jgi:hypothetical protein